MTQQDSQDQTPEVYADAFQVTVSPFGVSLTFSLREAHPAPAQQGQARPVSTVRTSLEHAKVIAMLLKRQLRNYEESNGIVINIPAQVYTQLGIAQEDWSI